MCYSFMRLFVLSTIIGCVGTDPSTPGNGTPLVGRWGGEHIALVLTDSVGSVEYDCAHVPLSSVPAALVLRADIQAYILSKLWSPRARGGRRSPARPTSRYLPGLSALPRSRPEMTRFSRAVRSG